MNGLPASLPRVSEFQRFSDDPFDFLAAARRTHGNVVVLREAGPLFSRAADCAGVVAVFGSEYQRIVLSDIESFGMPVSAARGLALPPHLINLNRGLHSMRAEQHAIQKRLMVGMLGGGAELQEDRIRAVVADATRHWRGGTTVGLLGKMRELTLQLSSQLLLGERNARSVRLAGLLARYFQLRREASSPANPANPVSRRRLIAAGTAVDRALRTFVRQCRLHRDVRQRDVRQRDGRQRDGFLRERLPRGLLGRLAALEMEPGRLFSEDEVVGHSNVLFVSSTEPIAITLTWILLVLSQLPALRDELRDESRRVGGEGRSPEGLPAGRLTLLDRVINETLRLLPPNAFMVRTTTRPTRLADVQLPERCEVVLCPFVAHRDSALFERPDEFLPGRWTGTAPSPFEYFPFGAGGHSCAGRLLALRTIKTALAFLLLHFDLILDGDQQIDWRVHIQFMPRDEPAVLVRRTGSRAASRAGGTLGGPVGKLLGFDTILP